MEVGGFVTSGALGMLGARGMEGDDEDEVGGLLGRKGGGFDSREVGRPCSTHTTPPSASNRSITASTCASVAPVESAMSSSDATPSSRERMNPSNGVNCMEVRLTPSFKRGARIVTGRSPPLLGQPTAARRESPVR